MTLGRIKCSARLRMGLVRSGIVRKGMVRIGLVTLGAFALALPAKANDFTAISGAYTVVSVRAASDIAGAPLSDAATQALGQSMILTEQGPLLEGVGCDAWQAKALPTRTLTDPLLADLAFAAGGPSPTYAITCEGTVFATVLAPDPRVLALQPAGQRVWLILERSLGTGQMRALAQALELVTSTGDARPFTADDQAEIHAALRRKFETLAGASEFGTPARIAAGTRLLTSIGAQSSDPLGVTDPWYHAGLAQPLSPNPAEGFWTGPWRMRPSGIACITAPCPDTVLDNAHGARVLVTSVDGPDAIPAKRPSSGCASGLTGHFLPGAPAQHHEGAVLHRYVVFQLDAPARALIEEKCF